MTGPGLLVRPVLADLDAVRSLDKHAGADRVRRALGGLAAEHAQFLGWMASDLGDHRDAAAWYSRTLRLAHQLDEPPMVVSILSMSSQLAVTRGQASDARTFAESGWQHASRASPGVLALLAQQHARSCALLGDRRTTEGLLDRAEDLLSQAMDAPDGEPPWTYFYAPCRLLIQRGVAYTLLGMGERAAHLIVAGLSGLPSGMARDRSLYLARLAHAHAVARDVTNAVDTAAQAAQIGAETGSAQTWRELSITRTKLEPYDREPSVRALAALFRSLRPSFPDLTLRLA